MKSDLESRKYNIALINQFLKDPNYKVYPDGTIETCITKQGHLGEWRIKPQTTDRYGYKFINYKFKRLLIHRIVYAACCGPLNARKNINHKDGNPKNNSAHNLEQISHSENVAHSYKVLGRTKKFKKLGMTAAGNIRIDFQLFKVPVISLADQHGVSTSTIYRVLNRKVYRERPISPSVLVRATES